VVAYNFFSSKIRVLESEMNNFSADFLNLVERELMIRKAGRGHGDGEQQ
jgi:biopolymer transport protein TolQ